MSEVYSKMLIEEDVESTPQYPFDREDFCKAFYDVFGVGFDEFDLFYHETYKAFVLWRNEDSFYIHNLQSKVTVSWYKHLGRINQCNDKSMDLSKLKAFFELLKLDYKGETKRSKRYIGLDIETYDPMLKTAGYSWKYGQGYILNTALYYEGQDKVAVVAGLNNDNCPLSYEDRVAENSAIKRYLKDPNFCIVGANLQYDIGWLLYEYGMSTYDVKCSFVDVLQAESILNEFDIHNLEEVSWKYLHYGKRKTEIEEWVHNNISAKGDFRQHLKDAPWDLLVDYVSGDAENPVKIWKKQLTLLKEQDLCARAKLEFDCILPILQITMNGYAVDDEQKQKNCVVLTHYRDLLKEQFMKEYNLPKFNVNSSRDIASFCDAHNIPYRYKVTLKGYGDSNFTSDEETDEGYNKAKKIVSQFRLEKGKPVAYIPSNMAERTCDLLKENGFNFNCSPNVDKKFFASQRDNYPVIATIADWKLCNGIISKILGEEYERFIATDKDGVKRIHPQFNITDTTSFRLSSCKPNGQQIPSKGGFTITENGVPVDVSFPAITRALFKANPNQVLWKIDYGQIEYRLICNIAVGAEGQRVRDEYAKNPKLDFHQYTVDLTGLSRKYAKNMSFGISFGMGLPSMAENFGWTMEKAEEIARQYNEHLPFVQPTLALVGDVAKQKGYIKTVCGSHARLKSPKKSYTMLNRYTQGSGAEILKSSIVRAYKEGLWEQIGVCNTVHDELNGSVYPTEKDIRNVYRMAQIMTTTVPLRVPLEAEPEFGENWASTKTIPEWLEIKENEPEKWEALSDNLKKAILIADSVRAEYNL